MGAISLCGTAVELAMRVRFFVLLVALIACVSARSDAATTSLPANGPVEILSDLSQFPLDLADPPVLKNLDTTATARTPLPATLSLFAGGLGALGLLGWRRKLLMMHRKVITFLQSEWPVTIVASGVVITIFWIALLTSLPLRLIFSVF
jgi:hypothetical protein